MQNHGLLGITIHIHLRSYDSFFYTRDERRSILRAAYKEIYGS